MNVSKPYLTDMASGSYLYHLKIHSEFFFQLASMLSYVELKDCRNNDLMSVTIGEPLEKYTASMTISEHILNVTE